MKTTTSKTSSLSTMRYLTLIVALLPGVSAFSGIRSQPVLKVASPGYAASGSGTDSTCAVRRSTADSSTRLHYISGANSEHTAKMTPDKTGSTWWNTIFSREQSSAADDYLEFLDRRYNRILHEDDKSKGFSVMNWLYQGTNREVEEKTQGQHEDDALYVLGVANLASKKFLREHHLPSPRDLSSNPSKAAIDVTDAEIVEKTSTPVPVAAVVALFRQVALRREVFVQTQSRSVRLALACVIRSVATSPVRGARAVQKLFVMGGGKKSVAMTFAALAALSFLLRPILKVAATEGANTMSP